MHLMQKKGFDKTRGNGSSSGWKSETRMCRYLRSGPSRSATEEKRIIANSATERARDQGLDAAGSRRLQRSTRRVEQARVKHGLCEAQGGEGHGNYSALGIANQRNR
jgi:predicted alpha/beta superfamily hydrolase